ncbi:MAG: hypothetical protein H0V79_01615 [Actinobacteria bacterium]|nr:hypothetical protein [Actinomycetota bacterium]
MEVFLRRQVDGALVSTRQTAPNDGWSPHEPVPLGNSLTPGSNVGVLRDSSGTLRVFARWGDGVHQTRRLAPSDVWASWQNLGGNVTSDPAVGMNADGRLEVFARGSDQSLVHRWEPFT